MYGPAIVGVAFWAFLAIAAVGGMVSDYKRRRLELEPLRAAIERGQPIDPALLERLLTPRSHEGKSIEPLYLRIGGIVTIAGGVGIEIMSVFIRALSLQAFLPLIGAGLLVVCVGVACWSPQARSSSTAAARPSPAVPTRMVRLRDSVRAGQLARPGC